MDIMKIIKEWAMPGALFGLGAVVLSMLFAKFIGPITLKLATPAIEFNVRDRIIAGLPTTGAEKIFGFFQGYLPLTGNVWVIAAISGIIIAIVGRLLYEFIPYKGNTQTMKLALIFFYGTVVLGFVFKTMTASLDIGFGQMLITMLLYYIVLAWVMGMVYKQIGRSVPV